jgi:hypothetical protein
MSDITVVLDAIQSGDPEAPAQLLPLIYEDLLRLAAHRTARESPGQTLRATEQTAGRAADTSLRRQRRKRLRPPFAGASGLCPVALNPTADVNGMVYLLRLGPPSPRAWKW